MAKVKFNRRYAGFLAVLGGRKNPSAKVDRAELVRNALVVFGYATR